MITDNSCKNFTGILFTDKISDRDFYRLSKFIQAECGIRMPKSKKTFLESRLQKRMRRLGMKSFSEYCDYVFSPRGIECEQPNMIDVVTTNETYFFREFESIDYLVKIALPELLNTHGSGIREKLILWSAGCSSGEEPFTLAMALNEFAGKYQGFNFSILATDISTRVLETARRAIYKQGRVASVPTTLKEKYFMRCRDKNKKIMRVVPEMRALVKYRRLNFMENDFGIRDLMDIIFCRNVIIYYDKATQEKLINRFCSHLKPGGYFFTGTSESLTGLDVPLARVSTSIYRKK